MCLQELLGLVYVVSNERKAHVEKVHWVEFQHGEWKMSHSYFYSLIIKFSEINGAVLKIEGGATLFPLQFIYEE